MSPTSPEPLVYSIPEAAHVLRVCPRTIANLLRRRELLGRKIGKRTVIPKTAVESFLKRDHKTK